MFYSWDELLDGGLYSGELTEIVGSAGSGKTQVRQHQKLEGSFIWGTK